MSETVSGSCLCGAVVFEATLPSRFRVHRHGDNCRCVHGAAFVTWGAFDLGDRDDYEAADFWPDAIFEQFFRRVYLAQESLILLIVQGVLTHLCRDPHLFDERLADTNFALRLSYYPPVPGAAPDGAGRLLGHEDVTLITMLPGPGEPKYSPVRAEEFYTRITG